MLKFIIGGKAKQILVDDYLPVFKSTQELVFSSSSKPQDLCISLIEKAYAKLHGSYFAFVNEPKEPDYILSRLTGLPSEIVSTSNEKHIVDLLNNPVRFPICFAKPKEETSEKYRLPPGYFFAVQEIIKVSIMLISLDFIEYFQLSLMEGQVGLLN